ncbi:integrase family protein [Rhizobium sp. Kim5]|uniref:hypothetical protein n=1 Tax=Rhizobium sp. Kim5 TaxID=2020311 RepID=UPI000A29ED38|nr:hypothetical protein [Rhizobium sp. Kim5]ARQ56941.1 integrase family protein [Rhizobium sp. Kim5]
MASKTTRVKIAKKPHIDEAERMAKAGMPTGHVEIYADDATSGLQLRVQGKRAFWVLKYGPATKTLGYVFAEKAPHRLITAVSEARELAAEAKKVLDDDPRKFESFLSTYYAIQERDPEQARKEARGQVNTWTLRQCIEYVIEDRTLPGAKEPLKNPYEYQLTLKRPELQTLLDQPVATMERGDFDDARDALKKQYGKSAANKAISNIRGSLDYCMRLQSKASGLSHNDRWWKLIENAGSVGKRDRLPTVDDIVKIMIVLEDYLQKPLPGRKERDGKAGVRANVFAAAWWLVLTGQRTFAALHLQRHEFFPDKEAAPGWYIAAWPKTVMKATVDFALPIPPRVVQHMLPLIEAAKSEVNDGSVWAFPSGRKPKKGSEKKDITVSQSAVRQALQRLRGRDPLMKNESGKIKDGAVDFFAKLGVPWWSPHDLRKRLGKTLDKAGIPGGSSAVLAHKIKMPDLPGNDREREEWLEQHVEDVTAAAYHNPGHMHLKSKAILIWTNAILDRYEELHPTHRQAKKKAAAERVLRVISSDAAQAEQSRARAMEVLPEVRKRLEATLLDHEQMLASLRKKTPAPVNDLRTALVEIEIAKADLDSFNANPASYAIEASRAKGVRGIHSLLVLPTEIPVDLEKEAPAYTELRDSYISGQIDYDTFRSAVVERYPITLDAFDDRTFVRPVTGDEVL